LKKAILLSAMLLVSGRGWAQGQWIDTVLPADHLLEVLPWMGEDGQVSSKGLFDFEDLRGAAQKDLILIYRPSVPVQELDKPHNQTLVVCFYDADKKDYVKRFQDDGGEVQWVRLAKGPSGKPQALVFLRNDLKGNQVLKGFTFQESTAKQVLGMSGSKVHVKFVDNTILCSAQTQPRSEGEAQKVFVWDQGKGLFADKKAGKVSEVAQAPAEKATASQAPGSIDIQVPGQALPSTPAGPQAAFEEFKAEIPGLVQKGQIAVVGQKAKAFFEKAQKEGLTGKEYASIRSTYYATVAGAVLEKGDAQGAAFYLKTALQLQPDNAEALAVQAKLK